MTSRVVAYAQIECDSCGTRREDVDQDATTARINASRDGWKYVAFHIRGKGLQKRKLSSTRDGFEVDTVPRQWDCCPSCPMPGSAGDAAAIRDERQVKIRGKWVGRESVS
jgi:hypothetical protein